MKIVTVEEMRELEAAAFASGVSEAELQRRAGQAVAEEVFKLVRPGARVAVVVGHGNNGRDGAVAAEWLLSHTVSVDLILSPRHAVTSEELAHLRAIGGSITASEDHGAVGSVLSSAVVAIDALAGIGAKGALREPLSALAAQLNAAREHTRIVALDLPSGVDADTGEVPGEAVWADLTVTLGAVKQGLLRFPAAERVGRLIPCDIGIPSEAEAKLPNSVLQEQELSRLVPPRPLDAHKYGFGRVLVIAGSDHFLGAPVLCAGGAARVGAGLVTVASTRDVRRNVSSHLPEVTFTESDISSRDGAQAARSLEPYLRMQTATAIGPGLGRGTATTTFVAEVLRLRPRERGAVIDADGLFALSEMENWTSLVDPHVVLTPHAGELERLVGRALDSNVPMWDQAAQLAKQWGCVLVAKGAFTCVASPDGRVDVWPRANPALATGGTGDVLAGVVAGLLAQGLDARDAARLAVGAHGMAASKVTSTRGWRTLLASDLLDDLPAVLNELQGPTRRR